MSSKTKIVVLRMKELIYTGIFVGLAILLVFLFLAMFRGKDKDRETSADVDVVSYIPGVYTAALPISSHELEVEVVVDKQTIKSIRLLNTEESVTTMYPLMGPTLESLTQQILEKQSAADVTYAENTKYTAYVLLQSIEAALNKAIKPESSLTSR